MTGSEFIKAIQSVGLGAFVVAAVVLVCVSFTLGKAIVSVNKWFKGIINNERADSVQDYITDSEKERVRDKVNNLDSEVSELKGDVSDLITFVKTSQAKTDAKLDELHKAINRQETESKQEDSELRSDLKEISNKICGMEANVNDLVESDQSSIKAFITEMYHRTVPTGQIDTLTMAVIEEKWQKYSSDLRHGNSFVHSCVDAMRGLKKVSVTETTDEELIRYISMYGGPSLPDTED